MAERLIIQFDRTTPDKAQWLLLDEHGNRIGFPGTGNVSDAAPLAAQRRVIVLVPGVDVTVLDAVVPTRNIQRMLQAVPYALEDRLAQDVDDLHFAPGPRDPDNKVPVAVIAHARLRAWLDILNAAGIEPDALLPDFLALPLQHGEWSAALAPDGLLLRTDNAHGCYLPQAMIATLLPMLLENAGRPAAVHLFYDAAGADAAQSLTSLLADEGLEYRESNTALLGNLALGAAQPHSAINLLQGKYRRQREGVKWWEPWKLPGGMAAVFLLVLLGTQISDYIALRQQETALDTRIQTQLREIFPDARETRDPRGYITARLAAMRGAAGNGGGFIELLTDVGEAVSQVPNVEMNALSFRRGVLDISLIADDVQNLDHIKQTLSAGGVLQVEIQAVNNRGEKIEGRMQITRRGA